MKKLVPVILVLMLALNFIGSLALADSTVAIADPVLERKIREALKKPAGEITAEDAAKLNWLDANAPGNVKPEEKIKDISALTFFTALEGLKLDNNAITDISVLSKLTNLKEFWVLDNTLDSIEPLKQLTKLVKLGFRSDFRDVSFVGNMPDLEELRIDGLKQLPPQLAQLKKLKIFCSVGGELTDISLLAQIPTLQAVDVSWNLVKDLTPLSALPLNELYLQGNPIEDYSPIKEIYPKLIGRNFDYIDLMRPENPEQAITFPDPVLEKKVRQALGIPKGNITAGDAAKAVKLELNNEWAPQIPQEIQIRDLSGIEYFINLRELKAAFNNISDVSPLAHLTQLKGLDLGGNAIGDIRPLAGLGGLQGLTLFGNGGIQDFSPLRQFKNLNSLAISGLAVRDLSILAEMTALDNLYADGCGIEDISPLAGMSNMRSLNLAGNYIADLTPLKGMANLASLKLANNPVQDYSPIKDIYPKLEEKDFEYGQVFAVDVPLKPEQPNQQAEIGDAGLEKILREATGIFDRPLTHLDLSRIGKLAGKTDTMWQDVSDLSALRLCLNLEGLHIYNAKVSDLTPVRGLSKLRWLRVFDCAVEDVSPLADLKSLTTLELNGNKIKDISVLKNLVQLELLDLRANQIADFSPLLDLAKLNALFISDNPGQDTNALSAIYGNLKEKDFEPGQPFPRGQADGQPEQPGGQFEQPKDPAKVIKFADKVLEKRIREAIGKPQGAITAGDAALVQDLPLGNQYQEKFPNGSQMVNLSGIEYFLNLKRLDISWNKVKDLRKLSGLSKLEYLQAYGNQITDLTPLQKLVNINNLNIGGNKVTKIDALKALVNLKVLFLDGNKIKDFKPVLAIYPNLTEKDFTIEK